MNQNLKTNKSEKTYTQVRNETGGAIAANKGVKVVGDSTLYDLPLVNLIAAVTDKCLGITTAAFADDTNINLLTKGRLISSGLDTAAAAVGDFVYLTATGDLSLIPSILQVGQVESLAASGTLYINVDGMLSGQIVLTYTNTDTITAFAGGEQLNATVLSSMVNRITVCATPGDSCKLPTSFAEGSEIVVINDGATRMDLFPASGDYIEGLSVDTAIQILPTQRVILKATTSNSNWRIINRLEQSILDYTVISSLGNANQLQAGHIFIKDEMGAGTDLALYLFATTPALMTDETGTFNLTNRGLLALVSGAGTQKNIFGAAKGLYGDGSANASAYSTTLLDGVNNDWYISFYLTPDDGQPAASQYIMWRQNDANNYWYLRLEADGSLTFASVQNGNTAVAYTSLSNTFLPNGAQSNPIFVQIYKSSILGLAIFINRKLVGIDCTSASKLAYTTTTGDFYLFSDSGNADRFTGVIDMLRVQNRLPSTIEQEIEASVIYTLPAYLQNINFSSFGTIKDSSNIEQEISTSGMFIKRTATQLFQYGFLQNYLPTDSIKLYGER